MENVLADLVGKPKSISKSESSVNQPTPNLQNVLFKDFDLDLAEFLNLAFNKADMTALSQVISMHYIYVESVYIFIMFYIDLVIDFN